MGAPLGQNLQPLTNRSGALFRCPITGRERDCTQVVTDGKRGNEDVHVKISRHLTYDTCARRPVINT